MNRLILIAALSAVPAFAAQAAKPAAKAPAAQGGLPEHYSKIAYPEFTYKPPHPSAYRVVLDKGVVAYLVPDTSLALIQMKLFFGHPNIAAKPEDLASLRLYSSLLKTGGTKRFTPEQLEDSLEFVAAALSAGLGDYQGEMGLDALRKDAYALLDLLPEVGLRPRLDAEAFRVQKSTYLENIRHRYDMGVAYEHVLFGPHPVGWIATEKEVEAATPARLKAWTGAGFALKDMVIAVSGQFDKAEMTAQLNKLVAQFPEAYKNKPDSLPPFRGPDKPGVYLIRMRDEDGYLRTSQLLKQ